MTLEEVLGDEKSAEVIGFINNKAPVEKFREVLLPLRERIEKFVDFDSFLGLFENVEDEEEEEFELPLRVKVWNGDRSSFLGEGEYRDNVDVYYWRTREGVASCEDPTQKPEGVSEDYLMTSETPRIFMDDGSVVYGCQTWWE